MSYVRKTQTMLDDVKRRVQEMRDTEVKDAQPKTSVGSDHPNYESIRAMVEKEMWKEAPELKDKMPPAWCVKNDSATLEITDVENDTGSYYDKNLRVHVTAPDGKPFMCPPNSRSYGASVKTTADELRSYGDTMKQWVDKAINAQTLVNEIKSKFATIESQLIAFLDRHASLNAALKAMPELELYIPQSYLDKVAQVDERKPKQHSISVQEELDIDVDALSATAIAHRMSTAGNQ